MNWRENWSRSKEVLGAYFRQGIQELGNAFYGRDTAAQSPEYGVIGTRLPSQIAEGMREASESVPSHEKERTFDLDAYVRDSRDRGGQEREPEREDRHLERE